MENPTKDSVPAQTSSGQSVTKSTSDSAQAPLPVSEPINVSRMATVDTECKKLVVSTTQQENIAGMIEFAGKLGYNYYTNKITTQLTGTGSASAPSVSGDKAKIKEILFAYSKNYVWLPMNIEKMYGDKQAELMKASYDVIDRHKDKKKYAYADELLKQVTSAVEEKHDYEFEAVLHKDGKQTAEAIAGGKIFISSGLLKDTSQKGRDYALFVISHEIAHVLQRHETKHLQDQIMDTIDLVDLYPRIKALSLGNEADAILNTLIAGKQLYVRNYIEQELQADSCGVKLMDKALNGKNKRVEIALNTFTEHLKKSEAKSAKVKKPAPQIQNQGIYQLVDFVSSPIEQHPNSEKRKANFDKLRAKLKATRT